MPMTAHLNRAMARSTARWRTLPDLLIIGAMRSGSSSLWTWLSHHPDLAASSRKEIRYFDLHYHRGSDWYRAFFPIRKDGVKTFESSPSYMVSAGAAERAASLLPNAVAVALLRDPAMRAWSQYRLRRSMGRENRSFEHAINEELASKNDPLMTFETLTEPPYLVGGLYAKQLAPWIESFGENRVLIVESEEMFADPQSTIRRVEDHVGVGKADLPAPIVNAAPAAEADDATMRRLQEFYRIPNRELSEMLGREFSWG